MATNKRARRELAVKKAKRKRVILIAVAALIALGAVASIIIGAVYSANTETYTDGSATIELFPNGRFATSLHHGERYSGTYVKKDQGIDFTYEGMTITTELEGNTLRIPAEWDDGHGHGSILTKR